MIIVSRRIVYFVLCHTRPVYGIVYDIVYYHCILRIYCWQKKIGSQWKHFLFWLRGRCHDLGVTLPSPLLFFVAYDLTGMRSRALYIRKRLCWADVNQ